MRYVPCSRRLAILLAAAGAANLAGAFAVVCSTPAPSSVKAAEAPVTYSRQIAPILYKNCSGCHHTGGSGPFSLLSYAEAKRWGGAMTAVTQSRYMPPWLPAPGHGEFADARRLSDDDIALIGRWVRGGMPEGDPSEAPRAPVYAGDWQLGPPDLVLEVSSSMQVPAAGADLFRNFILPYPLPASRWIRAMEIRPGSPRVVHHANLIVDRSASLRRMHPADWQNGIPGMDVVVDAGERFDPDGHFLDWKPDSSALVEPPGMPWRLDPGNDLILNMHLKPTGKPETVRAQIGLYFTPAPATRLPILLQLEHDSALDIPAGDPDFVVEDQLTLPVAVDVLALYPHAHYLGKQLEGWATLPDGSRTDLVLISNWDIDRQSIYRFAKPVALPAATVVHMRYSYDNSAGNPHNPSSPPVRVTSGNRSVDEMGHLWLQVLPKLPAGGGEAQDGRASLLRAWMENVLRKNPADATALFNLGSLDMSTGTFAPAAELYRRALLSRPGDARMTTAYGSALQQTGDVAGAEAQFKAAVTEDAEYPDAAFDLGTAAYKLGDYALAAQQFRSLLARSPDDAAAHAGLGAVLLSTHAAGEAQAEFARAVALDPANADALYNLATLEAADGDLQHALFHLRAASALRPDDLDTCRGLVALYSATGQLAPALEQQRRIAKLASAQPASWNDLGVLEARAGNASAAAEAFRHALALDPANAIAQSNLSHLTSAPH